MRPSLRPQCGRYREATFAIIKHLVHYVVINHKQTRTYIIMYIHIYLPVHPHKGCLCASFFVNCCIMRLILTKIYRKYIQCTYWDSGFMSKLIYENVISVKHILLNSHILHYGYGGVDQRCVVAQVLLHIITCACDQMTMTYWYVYGCNH